MAFDQWFPVSRRGGGEWSTQNITVPSGIKWVNIRLDVADADFATPDLSVTASIETSADGGNTWVHSMSIVWIGGPPPLKGGGRIAGCDGIDNYAGQLARVHFVTVGEFRWGLSGEYR